MKDRRANRRGRCRGQITPLVLTCVLLCNPGVSDESELYPVAGPSATDLEDRRLVGLRVLGFFDPLTEQPDLDRVIPTGPQKPSRDSDGVRYYLIQFTDTVTAAVQTRLGNFGLRVVGYVPHNGLVVGVPPTCALDELRSSPGLRYLGPFLPGYKLAPALFHLLDDEPTADLQSFTIDVELFPGEDPDALLGRLTGQFAGKDLRVEFVKRGDTDSASHITLEIDVSSLRQIVGFLLRARDVACVTRRTPLELYNDDTVWIGQSYDRVHGPAEARESDPKLYTESATIWNRGLTGAGQIVAVADTGLEYETCFWEDTVHSLTPQQVTPPGRLTLNPDHRKILALNGVNPVSLDHDDSFRHGTHVAATVAGDDHARLADDFSAGHDHGDGMAPDARIIFEDIGGLQDDSCAATLSVPSILDLLEQEYDAGARISSNSWGGSDDRPDEVDAFSWSHEIVWCCSRLATRRRAVSTSWPRTRMPSPSGRPRTTTPTSRISSAVSIPRT